MGSGQWGSGQWLEKSMFATQSAGERTDQPVQNTAYLGGSGGYFLALGLGQIFQAIAKLDLRFHFLQRPFRNVQEVHEVFRGRAALAFGDVTGYPHSSAAQLVRQREHFGLRERFRQTINLDD